MKTIRSLNIVLGLLFQKIDADYDAYRMLQKVVYSGK